MTFELLILSLSPIDLRADLMMCYRTGTPTLQNGLKHVTYVLWVWYVNFILTGTVLVIVL